MDEDTSEAVARPRRVVIGVDPGYRNLGVAVVERTSRALLDEATIDFARQEDDDATVCTKLVAIFAGFIFSWSPEFVVVELQCMNYRLKCIQAAIITACACFGVPSFAVSAGTIREHYSRFGTGFHGHAQNKLDSVAVAKDLLGVTLTDHAAEGYLMARWYCESTQFMH